MRNLHISMDIDHMNELLSYDLGVRPYKDLN